MKKVFQLKAIAFFALTFLISGFAYAQNTPEKKAPASPRETAKGMIGSATVSIDYGAPSLKGRKFFGTIEPYGKPWRAGANQATTFKTDKDITVEGKKLAAGTYTLFLVPGEKEWKVIFNSETGQWGVKKDTADPRGYSANEDPAKDVLVVSANAKKAGPTEQLKFSVDKSGFSMLWEDVELLVKIK